MLIAVNRELGDQRARGNKVSDTALAGALGMSKNTVGRRLAGQGKFSIDELEAMAHALGLTPDELWTRARRIQEETQSGSDTRAELLGGLSQRNHNAIAGMLGEPETEAEPESEERDRRSS